VEPLLRFTRPEEVLIIPLDTLWQSFGFHSAAGMRTTYHWKEIGQPKETDQDMQFWLRSMR
jgi:hypothetical protein